MTATPIASLRRNSASTMSQVLRSPKSNGFIERTVKTTLKKAKSSKFDPYLALLCIRTTPVDNVLPSQAEMLYTRKVQGNLPVRMRKKLGNKEEIYERLQQRQEVQRTAHDQHSRDLSPLFPGQNVRIQTLPSSLWSPAVVREKCQKRIPMLWKHKIEGCCEEIGDTYEE